MAVIDFDSYGGDKRMLALLQQIAELHERKQVDYGTQGDPFANVRASEGFGVPAWVGALIRLNDKVTRLKNFAEKGELANESAEDSMMDIAVYALISLILYREENEGKESRIIELKPGCMPECVDPRCRHGKR